MFRRIRVNIPSRLTALARRARVCRQAVEALEGRVLLAAQIVGSATQYSTIQAAVDAANPGDIVTVDPGTYNEQVVVSESITIEGAQAGIDARGGARLNGSASESIVTGATSGSVKTSAFYIDANDVTIDGFTVQGETNQNTATGAGIVISPGQHGTQIINNIVQNNVSGLFLANNSATDAALVQHNVFRNNSNDGANGGRGIYSDEVISGGNLTHVTIDSNLFSNNYGGDGTTNLEAACSFEAGVAGEQTAITITNNVMTNNGKAALFLNATNIQFNGNTVTGCQDQYSGSIRFEGNVQTVTLDNNNVHDNSGPAVAVDSKAASGNSAGFVLNNNDFVGNNAAYDVPISVVYSASAYDGVFNATSNWWGSASGPSGDGSGTGDAVSAGIFQSGAGKGWALLAGGNTTFSPWSTSPNTNNTSPPSAPTGLGALANSATQVTLNWTDTAAGVEKGFVVQQSLDGKTFTTIGTTSTGVTTYSDTSVSASTTYTYRVYATNSVGDSGYSAVATITTPVVVVVTAPSGLAASAVSSSQINLKWTDTAASVETGFIIQRSVGGGAFALVGTVGKGVTTFSNTGLSAGTAYAYRVEATSASGPSPFSSVATATTFTVVLAPYALTAVALAPTQVKLTWTDAASAIETGFIIERSIVGGAFIPIGTAAAHITTFTDKTVSPGTAYAYHVQAVSPAGSSAFSVAANIATHLTATAATLLVATAVNQALVHLTWADSAAGIETGFLIQRSSNGTTYAQIGSTLAGVTLYDDKAAVAGATYYYRILTSSAGGNSPASNVSKVTTPALPKAPTSLVATVKSATRIDLSWVHASATLDTGTVIQRSADGVTFTQIGTILPGVLTYSDPTALPGISYTYRVAVMSAGGNSAFSNLAKGKTTAVAHTTLAAAPTLLKAVATSATLVNLSWTNPSGTVATGFMIQRSTDGVHFTQVGVTAAGVLSYADHTTLPTVSYTYRVQAASTGGVSAASKTVAIKTPAVTLPAVAKTPTGLKALAASSTQIKLSWTNPAGVVATGFVIQRSTDGVHYTQIGMAGAAALAYSDKTAVAGVTYTYRIQATSAGGFSPNSSVATVRATPLPAAKIATAPSGALKAVAVSTPAINLSWTDTAAATETGFVIERSTDGVHFSAIGTSVAGTTTYADKSISKGIVYTYRVRALSAGGSSGYSNIASGKA